MDPYHYSNSSNQSHAQEPHASSQYQGQSSSVPVPVNRQAPYHPSLGTYPAAYSQSAMSQQLPSLNTVLPGTPLTPPAGASLMSGGSQTYATHASVYGQPYPSSQSPSATSYQASPFQLQGYGQPSNASPSAAQQSQHFVHTPTQAYQQTHSGNQGPVPRRRSNVDPYYHMSPNPQTPSAHPVSPTRHSHSHSHPQPHPHGRSGSISSTTSMRSLPAIQPAPYAQSPGALGSPGATAPTAGPSSSPVTVGSNSPTTERFQCELCERTFTRLHDRRRHYDSVHSQTAGHRCRCGKVFSRADSRKRHLDHGCEEASVAGLSFGPH